METSKKAVYPTNKWELKKKRPDSQESGLVLYNGGNNMRLSFFTCDKDYLDFLRLHDFRVPETQKTYDARLRPLVGIVLEIDGNKFYAPLSSPKPKHLTMKTGQDFIKINRGNYGVINLNNMVPILDIYAHKIDITTYPILNKQDSDYVNLITNQITWCNAHSESIRIKASKLFESIKNNYANENIKARCCDYLLLIQKSSEYDNFLKEPTIEHVK